MIMLYDTCPYITDLNSFCLYKCSYLSLFYLLFSSALLETSRSTSPPMKKQCKDMLNSVSGSGQQRLLALGPSTTVAQIVRSSYRCGLLEEKAGRGKKIAKIVDKIYEALDFLFYRQHDWFEADPGADIWR